MGFSINFLELVLELMKNEKNLPFLSLLVHPFSIILGIVRLKIG